MSAPLPHGAQSRAHRGLAGAGSVALLAPRRPPRRGACSRSSGPWRSTLPGWGAGSSADDFPSLTFARQVADCLGFHTTGCGKRGSDGVGMIARLTSARRSTSRQGRRAVAAGGRCDRRARPPPWRRSRYRPLASRIYPSVVSTRPPSPTRINPRWISRHLSQASRSPRSDDRRRAPLVDRGSQVWR